ncbi:MAG TPA: hypothetical protein ENL02_00780 [Epsilonproteobacteria bacterium]|nr:hypothetical protein [Campylobacterota bacterium]
MQQSLADYFTKQMQRQLEKRSEKKVSSIMMDMRDDGLDFYAELSQEVPLSYYCRGTRYVKSPEGNFTMEAADGTALAIDENEFRSRLDYALSCIGASSEAGVSVLVKKHIKEQ